MAKPLQYPNSALLQETRLALCPVYYIRKPFSIYSAVQYIWEYSPYLLCWLYPPSYYKPTSILGGWWYTTTTNCRQWWEGIGGRRDSYSQNIAY